MVAAGRQQGGSTFAEGVAGNNFGRGGPGKRRSLSLRASSEHIARYIPECCGKELLKSSEYEQNIKRKMALFSVGTRSNLAIRNFWRILISLQSACYSS